tara:strand:- start:56 stop:220 length:165 start_codon:yes stop_codon:yes gene_type:complete
LNNPTELVLAPYSRNAERTWQKGEQPHKIELQKWGAQDQTWSQQHHHLKFLPYC